MITLQAETQRVAEHFVRAGQIVSERDASQLDGAQQLVRQLILEEVARYGAARQFPKNHDSEAMRATFIDAQGTPCAMAHLLEFGGAGELATRISQETNHALVPQLAERPEFAEWLSAAGLTVEEAAIIQPSYACVNAADCVCGRTSNAGSVVPAKAVLQVIVDTSSSGRVEQVYGETTWRVGDVVSLATYAAPNQHVIIGLGADTLANAGMDGGRPLDGSLLLGAGEKYTCQAQGGTGTAIPINTETYAQAVMATDCKKKLIEVDSRFAGNSCGLGCSSAASSSPASVGILLAIAGVLLARRMR